MAVRGWLLLLAAGNAFYEEDILAVQVFDRAVFVAVLLVGYVVALAARIPLEAAGRKHYAVASLVLAAGAQL